VWLQIEKRSRTWKETEKDQSYLYLSEELKKSRCIYQGKTEEMREQLAKMHELSPPSPPGCGSKECNAFPFIEEG
jgi:hypothetical protein